MPRNRGASSSSAVSAVSAAAKQSEFENIVSNYLEGLLDKSDGIPELEIRFGTRGNSATTRENFDGVIQKLLSSGFTFIKKNGYSLKIQNEFIDQKTGQTKLSLIRAEIHGINDVQNYCKTNMPDEKYVLFTQKMYAKTVARERSESGEGRGDDASGRGDTIHPVIFDDFNFKVSYQREKRIANTSTLARSILKTWNDNKKTFRYINRTTLKHPDFPFQIDMSVVKESLKDQSGYISASTFDAAKVLESPVRYEMEIEVINDLVGPGTAFNHPKHLMDNLRKMIKIIMSGMQGTNYPISSSEMRGIQRKYYDLIYPDERHEHRESRHSDSESDSDSEGEGTGAGEKRSKHGDSKDKYDESRARKILERERARDRMAAPVTLRPKHFIGPSSYTLQMQNIRPIDPDSKVPNIRLNYSVTEKADGQRKLLFIAPKTGYVYLIDMNMNIQFTGAVSLNSKLHNSLLDGEHILHSKNGEYINLYLAFDVYFVHKADIRSRLFYPTIDEDQVLTNFRLPLMESLVKNLQLKCVSGGPDSLPPIRIETKKFEISSQSTGKTIFDCCAMILRKCAEHHYDYHTDGLIFTPIDFGVGSNVRNDSTDAGPLYKTTWEYSFKWKPAHMNTIDFLVTTKKGEDNEDLVSNVFKSGMDMSRCVQVQQYKTLVLRVGYDERKHGHLNPCVTLIEGGGMDGRREERREDRRGSEMAAAAASAAVDSYKPAPFYPTYPYDNDAHICHIMMRPDEAGVNQMMTTENDIIQDETIVEFSYDLTQPVNWRWSPLRVRHDKTSEYRSGGKNYGNAYHVANNNWHSIHNAITYEMIMTGEGIPDELSNDDVYYNHAESGGGGSGIDIGRGTKVRTLTKGMRDFHNLYIKRKLIMSVARPGNTLIDLAVGKGGDLPKWIASKLGFVFGIDYSKDNLEHKFDGVCARYLDIKKTKRNIPDAIFIHGDSSKEIRGGQAAISERYRLITRAIFGEGAKDASLLGRGVYPHYGRGSDGFDICSVQFAIHYFFENIMKLHTFLQNVSECTKLGGYFIGTCFDGARIFQALARLESGDEITVLSDSNVVGGVGSDPQRMWSVRKKYHQAEFEPDSSSIGYEIEVYQDSINKATREFLVNFDYLTQLLENYGFDLVSPEEAATTLVFPMPDGTATFDGMYHQMEIDCKKKREEFSASGGGGASASGGGGVFNDDGWSRQCRQEYGSALYMTPEEKQISFYNRYFIFRKNRNINAKQLKSSFLSYAGLQEEQDRAAAGASGEDDLSTEQIALEKIAKASRPIDVASKPAIAAHILEERRTEKQLAAIAGSVESAGSAAASKPTTMKIKPKPKKVTAKASAAAAAAAAEDAESEAQSAPIEQIEKKIQKRTKKVKASAAGTSDTEETTGAAAAKPKDNGESAAPKQKRQTKKKSDL
jgi:hypothetical protein